MGSSRVRIGLCVLLMPTFFIHSLSSNIATFFDGKCKNSDQNLNGPNGYPNGTCTLLDRKGPFESFQVVDLDPGCTGMDLVSMRPRPRLTTSVTLYGKDSDPDSPCSSQVLLEVDRVATCYNASWIYYSIDFCDPPEDDVRTSSTSTIASATSIASASSTISSTASVAPQASRKKRTGAIAGSVVGGVCALAIVAALVFLYIRRSQAHQRRAWENAPITPLTELSPGDGKHEIYTHQLRPQEIGRNSAFVDPVELHAEAIGTKKEEDATGSVSVLDPKR